MIQIKDNQHQSQFFIGKELKEKIKELKEVDK
jgi:hypothetical protein